MQEVKNQNRNHRIKNVKYIIQVVCVLASSACCCHFFEQACDQYVVVSPSTSVFAYSNFKAKLSTSINK